MPDPNISRNVAELPVLSGQVLTSWQTHGAKLEAVRAEFQTDPQHIRDVLRVWQLQGDKINAFLESEGVQENGGTGRLPAAHGGHTGKRCVRDSLHSAPLLSVLSPGVLPMGAFTNLLVLCARRSGCNATHCGEPRSSRCAILALA